MSTDYKPNQLLNEKEAAKFLACSVATLQMNRSLRRGVRFLKMGRSVRYRVSDLKEFIEANFVEVDPYFISRGTP